MGETVITDHRREKDLEDRGINNATVKAECGPRGRLIVEIYPDDFDRLVRTW